MNFQSEKDLQNSKIYIFYIMDITRAHARKPRFSFHFFSCDILDLAKNWASCLLYHLQPTEPFFYARRTIPRLAAPVSSPAYNFSHFFCVNG